VALWPGAVRGWSLNLIAAEPALRLSLFVLVLGIVVLGEAAAPRRARALPRRARWPANLATVALSTVIVRVTLPVTAVGMAVIAEERGWGLFHAALPLPAWAAIALSVVLLDLAIYLQHVLFHAVPLLWRLHRMHHADLDVDATTGTRFHPVEILLSMVFKLGGIVALGAPAAGVLVFEVLLTSGSTFNHGNLRLPDPVDRWLRWLVVTPDMHRVHHSIVPAETNSNFGFTLPWWDRLGGTYRDQPAAGHERMMLGIEQFRDPRHLRLNQLLVQPLLEDGGAYALSGRRSGR
jgi:sterol desaturase/sphingolipid hydroxylase (fatty acid hydroxylase superfamily)